MIIKTFRAYSSRSRKEKVRRFLKLMKAQSVNTLLDAGGNVGKGFEELRAFFNKVIVVDLSKRGLATAAKGHRNIWILAGDVCRIPLLNKSVDFVFSNAVIIEHIDKKKRHFFAEEVRRVARKGYFITTPNYWFPFEPHYLLPLWQYLPEGLKRFTNKYFSLGFCKKGFYEKIDLLSKKELKKLFPEANIAGIGIINRLIPETLICWHNI